MAADNVFLTEMGVSGEPEPSPAFRKLLYSAYAALWPKNGFQAAMRVSREPEPFTAFRKLLHK